MSNDAILNAHISRIMDEAPEMDAAWKLLDIEWHCANRHGVVRDVDAKLAGYVQRVIEWHLGHGACRWTKTVAGKTSVEFVHMTKVFPPPRRPWKWCGTTVLFQDWKAQEAAEHEAVTMWRSGDRVVFSYRGVRKSGTVIQPNRRTVSVLVDGEGRYTVPPMELRLARD